MTRLAQTILVATDFSQASVLALEAAAILARQNEAQLVLVHVHVPKASEALVEDPGTGRLFPDDATRKRLHAQLEQVAAERLVGLSPTIAVMASRSAPEGICHEAQHVNADLIVVATHGRTGRERMLIGSVAESVVRMAPCPVLTLRSKAKR